MTKYYFNEEDRCFAIQQDGDVGEPNAKTVIEISSEEQFYDPQARGVVYNNKRYDISVLKIVNGKIELDLQRINEIDSSVYKILRAPQRPVDIKALKKQGIESYKSLGEQLDMIWHELDETGTISKDGEWYKHVKYIKEKYPKPTE